MKGDRIGEFEELLLLSLLVEAVEPSVVAVQQHVEAVGHRNVSLGAVYAGLDRLQDKGLVRSTLGESSPARGGKRKRLFTVTREGKRVVSEARRVRERMWNAIEDKS